MIQAVHQPDALLSRMASLADPTRLRLMRLLERQELGVVDLCEVLQMPQSTVSRHLKILSDQGWTNSRRQGTTNLYELATDDLDPAAARLWALAHDETDGWATLKQDALRLERRLADRGRDPQAFFAGAAEQWDRLRAELYGCRFTDAAMAALMPGHWTVADLGCGTGHTAVALSPYVEKVIAIDNSAAMLKAARQRVKDRDNIDLRRGELTDLPIEDAACDAAVVLLVLTYVDDTGTALKEIARILKPDGTVAIVDLFRHDRDDFRRQMEQRHRGFTTDELESGLRDAGFRDARCETLPPEADAKGPALLLARAMK